MVTASDTTIPGHMLKEQYSNIYQNNMNGNKSFVGNENIIKSILHESNTASFTSQVDIAHRSEYITCQVWIISSEYTYMTRIATMLLTRAWF